MSVLTRPRVVLRLEGLVLAVALLGAAVWLVPDWWWVLPAGFLLVDLSALGYLRGPRAGAAGYNAGHSTVGPVLLGLVAGGLAASGADGTAQVVCTTTALTWGFHVGVDRAFGYGLKEPDSFHHTHLGWLAGRSPGNP
ncbi:DUF4260 domain-containing protein [Isoptericola haloaureus]|uniref:DUF4260 domain-containing protein n=1 Tax=Isoptericola haloaureus TaxID=1542902 RepID=A0ABU7Z9H8_9MICO